MDTAHKLNFEESTVSGIVDFVDWYIDDWGNGEYLEMPYTKIGDGTGGSAWRVESSVVKAINFSGATDGDRWRSGKEVKQELKNHLLVQNHKNVVKCFGGLVRYKDLETAGFGNEDSDDENSDNSASVSDSTFSWLDVSEDINTIYNAKHDSDDSVTSIYDAKHTKQGLFFIVLEFVEYGTLHHFLDKSENCIGKPELGDYTFLDRLNVLLGIAKGLEHIHDNKIIHCDLNPNNVMVDVSTGTATAKLIDFGSSVLLKENEEVVHLSNRAGTRGYASDEQQKLGVFGLSTDIYALGMIILAFFSDANYAHSRNELLEELEKHYKVEEKEEKEKGFIQHLSGSIISLMGVMICKDSTKRPSIKEVITTIEAEIEERKKKLE
mmetsp:Transcript_42324/g.48864  ORF Transcript_42324/g.48864 Transcript_42324/m.48864 type:complete len:380 (+) Transcript_42324:228-1367(+)